MGFLSVLGGLVGNIIAPGIGGAIGAGLGGAVEGSDSVDQASQAQQQSAQGGIDEQRRQFEAIQKLLSPYVDAGTNAIPGLAPYAAAGAPALGQQQALLGLNGPDAEREAIARISGGETFRSLSQQGENAILQNASATGGLRGGNVQAALAQFRPQLLSQLIEQQYGRLGGLTALGQGTTQNLASLGQNAAAGVGNAGMSTGSNIAALMGQQGAAQSGGILGQQSVLNSGINKAFGAIDGAGGFGKVFGNLFGGSGQSGMYADSSQIPMQPGGGF